MWWVGCGCIRRDQHQHTRPISQPKQKPRPHPNQEHTNNDSPTKIIPQHPQTQAQATPHWFGNAKVNTPSLVSLFFYNLTNAPQFLEGQPPAFDLVGTRVCTYIHRQTDRHIHSHSHTPSPSPCALTSCPLFHIHIPTGPYTYRTYYHKADVAFPNDGHSVEFAVNQKQVYQPDKSQTGAFVSVREDMCRWGGVASGCAHEPEAGVSGGQVAGGYELDRKDEWRAVCECVGVVYVSSLASTPAMHTRTLEQPRTRCPSP